MPRSLADLIKKCESLGYTVHRRGFRPAREDYLKVLRQHFIERDYKEGCPYTELVPMLCGDYHRLNTKQQALLWKDNNGWIAQRKYDGERRILHFTKTGVYAHSRVISTRTFRRNEVRLSADALEFTATIDCELVGLTHHVFDITSWRGMDLRKQPLDRRLGHLLEFQDAVKECQIPLDFPGLCFTNKQQFYEQGLTAGWEGIIFKRLDSQYRDSLRRGLAWIKCKKQLAFDCFVSSFEPGRPTSRFHDRIACLIFSIKTEAGPMVIAKVSNLPSRFRREAALYDPKTGKVELCRDVLGRVATVSGMEISRKAGRLTHPKILRWRGDLVPENCLYSSADIEAVRRGETGSIILRVI